MGKPMRRFIKTFFVKRVAQITVLQDGSDRSFEVLVWRAATGLMQGKKFYYAPGASIVARDAALTEAKRLLEAETPKITICAWCPGFDKTDPKNAGASHTMCADCQTRMNAELDEQLAERARARAEEEGLKQ